MPLDFGKITMIHSKEFETEVFGKSDDY